jgi:hypothetical protein
MTEPTHTTITLRTVPALAGWQWITRGWALLKANPIHVHMAVFFFFGALGLASIFPLIGSVLAAMLMPPLYLGVMATIAQAERTTSKQPGTLLDALGSPFRKDAKGQRSTAKRLAMLGLVYAAVVFTLLAVYSLMIDDEAFKLIAQSGKLPADAEARSQVAASAFGYLLGMFALYVPVAVAFWFTQQLVGWHGQSITKAVFFSWMGCWRNKAAFVVYGAAWVGIFMTLSLAVVALSTLIGSPALAGMLLTPLSLFLMVWVMCSFYASYESLVQVVE